MYDVYENILNKLLSKYMLLIVVGRTNITTFLPEIY